MLEGLKAWMVPVIKVPISGNTSKQTDPFKEFYLSFRKAIGVVGFLLPMVILVGGYLIGEGPLPSLSAYYYSGMRDVFVGCLFVVAAFLLVYRGYDHRDGLIAKIAGVSSILVACFPMSGSSRYVHFIAAFSMFSLMGIMSVFQFTKSFGAMTSNKKARNRVYRIAGGIIFLCLVLLSAIAIFKIESNFYVFFLETIMMWSFGMAWLVKGETLYKDMY